MAGVTDAIEAASKEIFITDWQISPHIFMKRPVTGVDSSRWRLDKMLLRKADQGVRIYILLYWESKKLAGMDLGSEFAQVLFTHENITVLRHPDVNAMIRHPISGSSLWSHHEKIVVVDRSVAFVGGIDLCFGRWDTHNHELTDNYPCHPCAVAEKNQCDISENEGIKFCRWVGKDYGNTFEGGCRTELDRPIDDYIDRSTVPRMPWHDVGCSFTGPPVRDVSKHFIQRYKSIKCDDHYDLDEDERYPDISYTIQDPSANNLRIQVLRSVDRWSADENHEASIYNAYLHAIENAQHSIYIENQFFISSQSGVFLKVENQLLSAMAKRIARAYRNGEDFHIYVIMPLKPEFPGEWDTKSGKDLRSVSYWNYLSLYNGEDSLYSRLEKENIPKEDIPLFFSVYGLRTHDILNETPVTEIVYVHSKLMIVDDKITIIGSANINDRSMLGSRDSEVAVMIEDVQVMDGRMKGHSFPVGKFSHSLRCHLMREHLGLLDDERYKSTNLKVEDPLALHPHFWEVALANTLTFERVFGGRITPTDHVWNFEDLKNRVSIPGLVDFDVNEAKKELSNIRGNIVIYPLLFLAEVLKPSYLDMFSMYVDTRGDTKDLNFDTEKTFVA